MTTVTIEDWKIERLVHAENTIDYGDIDELRLLAKALLLAYKANKELINDNNSV